MTAAFRITPRAFEDLRNIGRYTLKEWGKGQRDTYLKNLNKRFAWLAEQPLRGRHRPEITPGYYSFPEGSHVIFYLIGDNVIDIIGVPHQAMDIITYLSDRDVPYSD